MVANVIRGFVMLMLFGLLLPGTLSHADTLVSGRSNGLCSHIQPHIQRRQRAAGLPRGYAQHQKCGRGKRDPHYGSGLLRFQRQFVEEIPECARGIGQDGVGSLRGQAIRQGGRVRSEFCRQVASVSSSGAAVNRIGDDQHPEPAGHLLYFPRKSNFRKNRCPAKKYI